MSSDLFIFDGSNFYHHNNSSSSPEAELFFNDVVHEFSSSPFSDSSAIEILQAFSDPTTQQNQNLDQNPPDQEQAQIISPPSQELQSLNLYHQPIDFPNGFGNLQGFDAFHEVKSEECQLGFENNSYNNNNNFLSQSTSHEIVSCGPHSYSGVENVAKFMQRSSSSSGFLFSSPTSTLVESPPSFTQHQACFSSPESSFLTGHIMRRVCSTGDLQSFGTSKTAQRSLSSPLATNSESSFMEEANFKVGKYSAEERKERISKYRAKRTLRNFNKTIKYACRKTLADNRPRIRGRFARNDEPGETPKVPSLTRDNEDEDDFWLEGLYEEEEDNETVRSGQFVNSSYGPTQFQYYGF